MMKQFSHLAMTLTVGSTLAAALAAAPAGSPNDLFTREQRSHWAFQKVSRPKPPADGEARGVQNPIDAFILKELSSRQLRPSPPADKATLLRRATFDVIGLPPTPEDVDAF